MQKKRNSLHNEEKNIFREAVEGVRPLRTGKVSSTKRQEKKELPRTFQNKKQTSIFSDDSLFSLIPLSDSYTEILGPEDKVNYLASNTGLSTKVIQSLRHGKHKIERKIDLHGDTIESARERLSHELQEAYENQLRFLLIVHGKGSSGKIKNHVVHWLKQIPWVLFFCSAELKDGGTGALYVFIKKKKLLPQEVESDNLTEVRKKIDALDNQIATLLCQRLSYAKRAAELKKTVTQDVKREENLLARIAERVRILGYSEKYIVEIFQSILIQMRKYQADTAN